MNAARAVSIVLLAGSATLSFAAAAQVKGPIPTGKYECWANGQARLLMNFLVSGPGRYSDHEKKESGSFTLNESNGQVTFKGGHLDGVMPAGFIAVYHVPKGRPSVSFRSGRGAEAAFCEKVG